MLIIKVGSTEMFDEETNRYFSDGGVELHLEHSLVSLSKWESEFEKPFLDGKEKSVEELVAYVRAMTLNEVPEEVYSQLDVKSMEAVNEHINRKMTATWFNEPPTRGPSRETITAELIYYWMTAFSIPFECQHWHLNRLFTLIRVCNAKQEKPKAKSPADSARARAALNAQRRADWGTTG